jgi:hypothetical protein
MNNHSVPAVVEVTPRMFSVVAGASVNNIVPIIVF